MPFESKRQQRKCYAMKARGENGSWNCDEFSDATNFSKLPEKKSAVDVIAAKATTHYGALKLAADLQVDPIVIEHFADTLGLPLETLVKRAYANPRDFADMVKIAVESKSAPAFPPRGSLAAMMKAAGMSSAASVLKGLGPPPGARNSMLGRIGAVGAAGAAGLGLANHYMGAKQPTPRGVASAGAVSTPPIGMDQNAGIEAVKSMSASPDAKPSQPAQTANTAAQSTPQPKMETPKVQRPSTEASSVPQGARSDWKANSKLPLLLGGLAGGGGALLAMYRRRRASKDKQNQKQGSLASTPIGKVIKQAVEKRAAATQRRNAVSAMTAHLDEIASRLPIEKTAAIRVIQKELAVGQSLGYAIKAAYPHLAGETRGVLASRFIRSALAGQKQGMFDQALAKKVPTTESMSASIPIKDAGKKMKQMC